MLYSLAEFSFHYTRGHDFQGVGGIGTSETPEFRVFTIVDAFIKRSHPVIEDPNQAAVVVVIKRGAKSIEQRIKDTCGYRTTNPWTQGGQ